MDITENFYAKDSNDLSIKKQESKCLMRLQQTFSYHKEKPLPVDFKSRLDGPSVNWKIFKKLQPALSYCETYTKDGMVFAFEERAPDSAGRRLFLVTHPKHMWLNYKSRALAERCSYEVISDGHPCKLYFDLEYSKKLNPYKDETKMIDIFMQCVIACLFDKYKIKSEMNHVLKLDSSTNEKFSSHLIFQMKNFAFKNNIETGRFVSYLILNMTKRMTNDKSHEDMWPNSDDIKSLLVLNKDGNLKFFCDIGVYTKNRNFRLYLSTKFGKNVPLVLSKSNSYIPSFTNNDSFDELIFYDSLITYFRNGVSSLNLISFENEKQLICPQEIVVLKKCSNNSGHSSSPFPEIDAFILNLVKDEHAIGFIRKCFYNSKLETIQYDIGNYRFCHNIGRHHKSNNIMMMVDLKHKEYYQKCYDPECRILNFRSEAKALPNKLLPYFDLPEDFFETNIFSQDLCDNFSLATQEFIFKDNSQFFQTQSKFEETLDKTQNKFEMLDKATIEDEFNEASLAFEKEMVNISNNIEKSEFQNTSIYQNSDDENNIRNLPDDFWKLETDSSRSIDNFNEEEEMMMALAVDAVEANENLFDEETIF